MRYYLTLFIAILTLFSSKAEEYKDLSYSLGVEYGWDFNVPSYNPIGVKIAGLYNFNRHWGVGAETGITKYEKVILPVAAYGSYHFTQKKKFIPFIDVSIGYGISLAKESRGGFLMSVSMGTEYKLSDKINLLLGLGYQTQSLSRILKHSDEFALIEFREHLTHNTIGIKIGVVF